MVQAPVGTDAIERFGRAGLGIDGAEHQPTDARMHHGPHTHEARLEGHGDGDLRQPLATQLPGGTSQGSHFGMPGRVAPAHIRIPGPADDAAVHRHYGAHGNLSPGSCPSRLGQCGLHEADVVEHEGTDTATARQRSPCRLGVGRYLASPAGFCSPPFWSPPWAPCCS